MTRPTPAHAQPPPPEQQFLPGDDEHPPRDLTEPQLRDWYEAHDRHDDTDQHHAPIASSARRPRAPQ